MMTAQHAAQLVARLTDAFEFMSENPPQNTTVLSEMADSAEPTTIAECVPLIAIALELINRGPTTISIEGVESYRTKVLELLSHIRPVIEREAKLSLADWTSELAGEVKRRAA